MYQSIQGVNHTWKELYDVTFPPVPFRTIRAIMESRQNGQEDYVLSPDFQDTNSTERSKFFQRLGFVVRLMLKISKGPGSQKQETAGPTVSSCSLTYYISVTPKVSAHQAPLAAQTVKNLREMWEIQVRSLGRKIPWRRKWQPTQVWRIPRTDEPGGLQSMWKQKLGT